MKINAGLVLTLSLLSTPASDKRFLDDRVLTSLCMMCPRSDQIWLRLTSTPWIPLLGLYPHKYRTLELFAYPYHKTPRLLLSKTCHRPNEIRRFLERVPAIGLLVRNQHFRSL